MTRCHHQRTVMDHCLDCWHETIPVGQCQHPNLEEGYCIDCGIDYLRYPPCSHDHVLDCICLGCDQIVSVFSEYENVYDRDLAPPTGLNNFNYVTNLLPHPWRELLRFMVMECNMKFINRVILQNLPTDMSIRYCYPKIRGSKGKILCRPCGRLYEPSKAYLHKKHQSKKK